MKQKKYFLFVIVAATFGFIFKHDNPFPVQLVYFSGYISQEFVDLRWGTATEISNYGFDIHRTDSLFTEWETIGFVEGSGNSNSPKHYSFMDTSIIPIGKYNYRLKQIDTDGTYHLSDTISVTFITTDMSENNYNLSDFALYQNYPNPFNPQTVISWNLPEYGRVKIELYSSNAELITTLLDNNFSSGYHTYILNSDRFKLTSGVYFYRIVTENFIETKKMCLVR